MMDQVIEKFTAENWREKQRRLTTEAGRTTEVRGGRRWVVLKSISKWCSEENFSPQLGRGRAKLIWTFIIPHFKIRLLFTASPFYIAVALRVVAYYLFRTKRTSSTFFNHIKSEQNNKKSWSMREREEESGGEKKERRKALHFWSYHKNERKTPHKLSFVEFQGKVKLKF